MNARIAVFIVSRLLGLYVLVAYTPVAIMQAAGAVLPPNWPQLMLACFWLVLDATGFVILWFGAGWISGRLVAGLPDASAGFELDVNRCKVLAIAVVGGLFILTALQSFAQIIKLYIRHDPVLFEGVLQHLIFSVLFFLISGIAIIAWSGAIVDKLTRLRAWGSKPFIGDIES